MKFILLFIPQIGFTSHPIFSENGDYSEIVRNTIAENSKNENLQMSRLPIFTQEEMQLIKGSADFFGVNYFTSTYAESGTELITPTPSYARDQNVIETQDSRWSVAASNWLRSAPKGLKDVLK